MNIIAAACESIVLEFHRFSNSSSGNPTPTSEPFTSKFILEEIEAYLKDDSISPEIDYADCDPEKTFWPWHDISDIKGIDPHFCTHKILMEDDYKPMVQSQRRVNPKIHEVIKKEVLKLLDAGMMLPNSPTVLGVSPSIVFQERYGYCKNLKKTFKAGQTRTRERKECTRAGDLLLKDLKAPAEWLRGLETHFEQRNDGGIYFFDRIWIPSVGGVRKLILDEAHTSRYSIHLGADKMYD
ncbi:hypothetical protein Tco_0532487 [Tanacetum coccineum]